MLLLYTEIPNMALLSMHTGTKLISSIPLLAILLKVLKQSIVHALKISLLLIRTSPRLCISRGLLLEGRWHLLLHLLQTCEWNKAGEHVSFMSQGAKQA